MTDRRLTPFSGVLILGGAFLLGNLLSFAFALFLPEGDARTFVMYTLPQVGNVAAVLIGFKVLKIDFFRTLPVRRNFRPVPLLSAPMLTVATMALSMALLYGFGYLTSLLKIEGSVAIPPWNSAVNVVFGILCLSLLPAIGEELLFRGALLKSLRPLGAVPAIFLSALLFAVSHMSTAQLVHQFILGSVLSYLVVKTDNLWYGVLIHFLNNLAAQILNLFDGVNDYLAVYSLDRFFVLLGITVVGAVLTALLLLWINKSKSGSLPLSEQVGLFGARKRLHSSVSKKNAGVRNKTASETDALLKNNANALKNADFTKPGGANRLSAADAGSANGINAAKNANAAKLSVGANSAIGANAEKHAFDNANASATEKRRDNAVDAKNENATTSARTKNSKRFSTDRYEIEFPKSYPLEKGEKPSRTDLFSILGAVGIYVLIWVFTVTL